MPVFTVHQAKTNLSKLIELAEKGEEVVIARGTKPAVRVTAIEPHKPKRKFGAYKGQFTLPDGFFDPLSVEELADWENGNLDTLCANLGKSGKPPRKTRKKA
jgi:antitoxin (DNA-binding transcriptional repressor) of toxin-antitoxin stability system